jgi:uncharacterized protein YecE (DUF72 family)
MIYAGCSGYSFREWVGHFYPPKTPSRDFLSVYVSRLDSVEINHTFRRFPRPALMEAWADTAPESFRFSVKMHQSVTHSRRLRNVSQSVRDFLDGLTPLGSRLGVVLFQLPPTFRCDLERLDEFLAELPPGVRYAMEFRHDSWLEPSVTGRLRDRGVCLCASEVELVRDVRLGEGEGEGDPVVTAPFAYVRFRKAPPYADSELESAARYVRVLKTRVDDVYLYVKHDELGLAPTEVLRIREMAES